ncbi:helix-turn-helix domain-containing protein [Agriterribacter sp.]|uniref:helix-turn-helix domain-containing protein n=1 Tax=Agriterribacter sp. TaxID=2821509 RepID=UPI002C3822AE|nr:helix-turn-helix domain-containing protein [Agriterribacter sp.]HTN06071.1 helix-turn-helix domain-containing protein [Agriterribacter sp.]
MANRKGKSDDYRIENEKDYNATMKKIDALMKRGEANLTDKEAEELRILALAAQAYEKSIYTIPAPKTLEGLIELKMYERKLKQKELARLLGVGEPKLSQIMSKKRKPDVAFLKAAHKLLGIDGNVLLDFV